MLDFKPLDRRQFGAPTYATGQHSGSLENPRLIDGTKPRLAPSPELIRARPYARFLLCSPLLLWLSHVALVGSIDAELVEFPFGLLSLAGVAAIAFALWQTRATMRSGGPLHRTKLAVAGAAMVGLAIGYPIIGLQAYGAALMTQPERVLVSYENCGRRCTRAIYQRVDGSLIWWAEKRPLPAYAPACASVQTLTGNHGFTWVRVRERSRPPARGQLLWPVRASDCFSDTPLSELPR